MHLPFERVKNIPPVYLGLLPGKAGSIGQMGWVIHQCLNAQFHKLDRPAGQIKITQLSCRIIKII